MAKIARSRSTAARKRTTAKTSDGTNRESVPATPSPEEPASAPEAEPVSATEHDAQASGGGTSQQHASATDADASASGAAETPAGPPVQTTRYPADALYFDAAWYRAAYPDVEACGMDAVEHFMTHGYLEGRNPNAIFRVDAYIAANPDISLTINPFLHFIMYGASEGRPLHP
ncbi:hypothetical protein [Swaminathania salitolerans]|uniref:Uncharacterized protein n=1 Tax=Swaminathania salitolerans TaxID=182838 RepID=A0A511BQN6_9PROT|nr:hypothetical protein [Swaminathania salitolerans]GBQ14957.1 hypothetical protein AA21291_2012 [Swaminathania salitolerans LMG 21291]GEL01944.1 hypothetical protein SSA02_11070 [Swaminathania salitolerans]